MIEVQIERFYSIDPQNFSEINQRNRPIEFHGEFEDRFNIFCSDETISLLKVVKT